MESRIQILKNRILFYMILGFLCLFFPSMTTHAMDTTAPQITGIHVEPTVVSPGDTLRITFDVIEDETGLSHMDGGLFLSEQYLSSDYSEYSYVRGNIFINFHTHVADVRPYMFTGQNTLTIDITEETVPGVYTVADFNYRDLASNEASYHSKDEIKVTVVNPDYDQSIAPKIVDFEMKQDSINVEDPLNVDVTIDGNYQKVRRIDFIFRQKKYSSSGQVYYGNQMWYYKPFDYESDYNVTQDENGYTTFHISFTNGCYIRATEYQLISVQISYYNQINPFLGRSYSYDSKGDGCDIWKAEYTDDTCTTKSSGSLTYLNYEAEVVAPSTDTDNPVLNNVTILNKTIGHPDTLVFSYDATDNVGVSGVGFTIYRKSDGVRINTGSEACTVAQHVTSKHTIYIGDTTPIGTYTLYVAVYDTKGNASEYWIQDFEITNDYLEGYDVDFEIGINHPNLVERVNELPDHKAALIRCERANNINYIPKAVFESIQGRDAYIIVRDDYYCWIFYGKDVTQPKDVWVNMELEQIHYYFYDNPQTLEEVNDSMIILRLKFPDNGVLPGKMQVRFKSNYLYTIYHLEGRGEFYLYFENPVTNGTEIMSDANALYVLNNEEHWCYFNLYHHSNYLLSGRELTKKQHANTSNKNNPITIYRNNNSNTNSSNGSGNVKTPGKVKKVSFKKASKGRISLSWNKSSNAKGYEIQYSTSKNFKKGTKTKLATNYKNSMISIKKGKVYYVRVRAYNIAAGAERGLYNKYSYSAYSPVVKVKR